MRLLHITSNANAEAILKDGFRDATRNYFTDQQHTGVWVSDEPDTKYIHSANIIRSLEIPEDVISEFQRFE